MSWTGWIWIALSALAALVLAVVVWIGGPLISIGDFQPLEGVFSRAILILVIFALVIGGVVWSVLARRKAAAALEKAMTNAADDSDAAVLKERMQDALETLKRASGGAAAALYDLPWYLIIGPPGAGKTTALVNSGLRFPLAGDAYAKAVPGMGGTRYCDWWFTDRAVLIDTAGRYTTQDSDAKLDRASWQSFLGLLGQSRPRQPINGVIVAIAITDVLALSPAEVAAHADAIRKRLAELHDELKVDFPVYAMFTKMDLVVGFNEYFADLDEEKRRAVWGATFQTADKRANRVGDVPAEIDLLIERVARRMPDRLQFEPDLRTRAIMFGFPAQLSAIRKPIAEFLNRIFEPTRYQTSATLRGVYFTSGTQVGTPLDAIVGALQKSFGVDNASAPAFSGPGRSYFLHDLMTKVIFAEAGWVSTNIAAVRRSLALRAAAFALVGLVTAGLLALWGLSYSRNAALISATKAGVEAYAASAAPLIRETNIADPDVRPVYELVDALPNLPAGYAHRHEPSPLAETFGLDQRPRLLDASETLYHTALERLMRPRLLLSLEQQIQQNKTDATYVYEALKVYLMLGKQAPTIDERLIVNWFTRDWEDRLFPGAPYAQGRARLKDHLLALLALDRGRSDASVSLNGPLVAEAQATLARMRVAERAYTLLKAASHNEPLEDWVASQRGGPDMALVFEAANGASLDTVRVPAFFTYDGFYVGLLDRMTTIADTMQKEKWALGAAGQENAVKQQYASLLPDLLQLYGADFTAAWTTALANLQLRKLFADKPKYLRLSAASAPTSPIRLIFESVRDQTSLTRERKKVGAGAPAPGAAMQGALEAITGPGRTALELALKSQRRAGEPPPETPGAAIEANFRPFQILVDGEPGSRPIDALLANLNELYRQLTLAATNPAQAKQALDQAQVQVASLRANVTRLPQPLAGMIDRAAKDAAGDATSSSIAELSEAMAQEVTGPCLQITGARYPFAKSDKDTPLADFARLFAPNGLIDRFFSTRLAPLANVTGKTWSWRQNPDATRKLSEATLRQFQAAADIRDAFFPTGGSAPNLSFEVKLLTLNANAQSATLTVNGTAIASPQGSSTPGQLQWPGAGAAGASITLAPDVPDQKSTLERMGPWALFRLVDAGVLTRRGNVVNVGFVVGGRDVSYAFGASSLNNPLTLPALRQFKCPNGL